MAVSTGGTISLVVSRGPGLKAFLERSLRKVRAGQCAEWGVSKGLRGEGRLPRVCSQRESVRIYSIEEL